MKEISCLDKVSIPFNEHSLSYKLIKLTKYFLIIMKLIKMLLQAIA